MYLDDPFIITPKYNKDGKEIKESTFSLIDFPISASVHDISCRKESNDISDNGCAFAIMKKIRKWHAAGHAPVQNTLEMGPRVPC